MQLKTTRCFLRHFVSSDLDAVRELDSDSEVMKFTPARIAQTLDESKSRLQRWMEQGSQGIGFGIWGAFDLRSSQIVGWFMLIETDLKYPELGFMLVRSQWGNGLATEVSQAVLEYGFQKLKLTGVSARTHANNVASIQVLKKLGFRQCPEQKNGLLIFECQSVKSI